MRVFLFTTAVSFLPQNTMGEASRDLERANSSCGVLVREMVQVEVLGLDVSRLAEFQEAATELQKIFFSLSFPKIIGVDDSPNFWGPQYSGAVILASNDSLIPFVHEVGHLLFELNIGVFDSRLSEVFRDRATLSFSVPSQPVSIWGATLASQELWSDFVAVVYARNPSAVSQLLETRGSLNHSSKSKVKRTSRRDFLYSANRRLEAFSAYDWGIHNYYATSRYILWEAVGRLGADRVGQILLNSIAEDLRENSYRHPMASYSSYQKANQSLDSRLERLLNLSKNSQHKLDLTRLF